MPRSKPHKAPHPATVMPDDFEPGPPPVEPEEGPTPAVIPEDPEHDRLVDPED